MKEKPLITIHDFSSQLSSLSKRLSFLNHPVFPMKELQQIFPQHHQFFEKLTDSETHTKDLDVAEKRKTIDFTLKELERSELNHELKTVFTGRLMDYSTLCSMKELYGTPFFYEKCMNLYGTSRSHLKRESLSLFLGELEKLINHQPDQSQKFDFQKAKNWMEKELIKVFPGQSIEVCASTGLLADSSAGRKVLKLAPGKTFSELHLKLLLVHEGWVHLGTSLNGAHQKTHPWLATWAPRTTYLQEGLALLAEFLTHTMTIERWNKVVTRHMACMLAEEGSSIKHVYEFVLHQLENEEEAIKLTLRIFRGVSLEGGQAFTKELLYLHGLAQLLYHTHFLQADLSTLFIGKMSFEEHLMLIDSRYISEWELTYFPEEFHSEKSTSRFKLMQEAAQQLFKGGFL